MADNSKTSNQFQLQDLDWWIREGVIALKAFKGRNIRGASASATHYHRLMLGDGEKIGATKYEKKAQEIGLRPWSGLLVQKVITEAFAIAAGYQSQPTNIDVGSGKMLTNSHMAHALRKVSEKLKVEALVVFESNCGNFGTSSTDDNNLGQDADAKVKVSKGKKRPATVMELFPSTKVKKSKCGD